MAGVGSQLLVLDRHNVTIASFSLLSIASIIRSNKHPDQLAVSFRDPTAPKYDLRFQDSEEREQFCMAAYILEPDLVFTNDSESRCAPYVDCPWLFVALTRSDIMMLHAERMNTKCCTMCTSSPNTCAGAECWP